jgi:hypothetical protein
MEGYQTIAAESLSDRAASPPQASQFAASDEPILSESATR